MQAGKKMSKAKIVIVGFDPAKLADLERTLAATGRKGLSTSCRERGQRS